MPTRRATIVRTIAATLLACGAAGALASKAQPSRQVRRAYGRQSIKGLRTIASC